VKIVRYKGADGFTLIECVVATLILAIGIVGVASMFVCASASERKAAYMAQARAIAEQTFETVQAQGYAAFGEPSGSETVPTPGLPRATGVLAWQPYPDESSEEGLKLVALNIAWDSRGPTAGRYRVVTLVSEQGGG
jgi:prepilin-type N-terminal cleavage/methylation domain-containing protein